MSQTSVGNVTNSTEQRFNGAIAVADSDPAAKAISQKRQPQASARGLDQTPRLHGGGGLRIRSAGLFRSAAGRGGGPLAATGRPRAPRRTAVLAAAV